MVACSFGTATTIDVVSADKVYVGGIIAPGMATVAKALQLATAKLPNVSIEKPEGLIGRSTVESIRSGIVNGHIAMVEGLLAKIEDRGKVIATGRFARLIAPEIQAIDVVDENLTLSGLRMLKGRAPVGELAFESEMVV